ncbi:uncharacterized protein LOC135289807 isoform X1 [Passer domesticus]|uniref:uncharacterized protein LOC135289807 isoform X1 n=1 Tax=Passer domesticus TaxID=48849 RepID=UPI0030FF1AF5
MLPTLQIKSTEGCISLLPCDTGEATAAVVIFLICVTQRIYLQEESCSKGLEETEDRTHCSYNFFRSGEGGTDTDLFTLMTSDRTQENEKMNSQYMRHEVRGCETSDLRNFWEKTIEQQTQYLQNEKERQRRSALTKLRNEWMERLEKRIKMLRTQSEDSSS